jgi:hypothetical protein
MSEENKQGMTPEELQAFYTKVKKEFKPEDLIDFFTEEEGIPLDDFIKEIEETFGKPKTEGDAA